MKLGDPQLYYVQFHAHGRYRADLGDSSRRGFQTPATLVCPKIYVVTESRGIHYVGITNRPMAARLNFGLRATGAHGYYGYRFRKIRRPLRLYVWSFPKTRGKMFLRQLETVEAEFAFLTRKRTGKWPISQTEIHFFQATPAHLAAVHKMYSHCTSWARRTSL